MLSGDILLLVCPARRARFLDATRGCHVGLEARRTVATVSIIFPLAASASLSKQWAGAENPLAPDESGIATLLFSSASQ